MPSRQEPSFDFQERWAGPPGEERFPPAAVMPQRQGRDRIALLGVLLPAVAGAIFWLLPALWDAGGLFSLIIFIIAAIATIVLTFFGAALLHSWWALLAVPVAWVFGETLASVAVSVALYGVDWLASSFDSMIFWLLTGVIILLEAAPILICAALGVVYGKWLQQQRL